MINREILKELIPVTDEEQAILDGRSTVDSSIYTENADNIISSRKLLKDGKLITIRTHTRFIHFPEHTHNFVEVVYMCTGKTTHIINGKTIDLSEGELLFLPRSHNRSDHKNSSEKSIDMTVLYTKDRIKSST